MGQSEQAVNTTVSQWVTFRLGEETYGIDVLQVQEVLRVSEISPVPGALSFVIGIINLRGNVVTVLDARHRFGLPPKEPDDASRIIVVNAYDKVIGLLVDSVSEVNNVQAAEIEGAPTVGTDDNAKFVSGVCNRDGELLILVDLAKLLDACSPCAYGVGRCCTRHCSRPTVSSRWDRYGRAARCNKATARNSGATGHAATRSRHLLHAGMMTTPPRR